MKQRTQTEYPSFIMIQKAQTEYLTLSSKNPGFNYQQTSYFGNGEHQPYTPNQYMRLKTKAVNSKILHSQRAHNFKNIQFADHKSNISLYSAYTGEKINYQLSKNYSSDILTLQEKYNKINNHLQSKMQKLKEQNQQLLFKCKQVTKKKQKYKHLYAQSKKNLQQTIQQRQSYKQKANQLMKIVKNNMLAFQKKMDSDNLVNKSSLCINDNKQGYRSYRQQRAYNNKYSQYEPEQYIHKMKLLTTKTQRKNIKSDIYHI